MPMAASKCETSAEDLRRICNVKPGIEIRADGRARECADMLSSLKRRFTLIDALGLVAATAIGLALLRPALIPLEAFNSSGIGSWPWVGRWPWTHLTIVYVLLYATLILLAW